MWWQIVKYLPILLASSLDSTTNNVAFGPPQTPMDLSKSFRQVYSDLEKPGAIFNYSTPTLRFSYVSPPLSNGTSTWKLQNIPAECTPNRNKPLAIYVPGLDGYGISAHRNQFDDLARSFDFWRLTILPGDRSSFTEIVKGVSDFVNQLSQNEGRSVTLIGESCGGLIAAAVAYRLKNRKASNALTGLVLVNPATSFARTSWDLLAPLLTSLQYLDTEESRRDGLTPYSVFGSLILSTMIPDRDQTMRIFNLIRDLPGLNVPFLTPELAREITAAAIDSFRGTEERLPPELLDHRVKEWLMVGSSVLQSRLKEIDVQTLVVAGSDDSFIPSKSEAERLVKLLPSAEKLIVNGRGHFVLDENVNLTEAILYSKIDPLRWKTNKKKYDVITDWELPPPEKIKEAIERSAKPLRDIHSPVFFTTSEYGERWLGLSKFPETLDGPLLIVGNHQFAALDLNLVVPELLEKLGIFVRGLAHPVIFMNSTTELQGRTPGILRQTAGNNGSRFVGPSQLQEFGAVPVTPRNYYRLLQSGQNALLFPGGAKEALSGRKDYPLFWTEKVDFVRTAARFNATILPLSAIGMVDSVNVILETEEIFRLPFIGERARQLSGKVTAARYDVKAEDETLLPPLALPSVPQRNYFLFGKPIRTNDVDPRDKEACHRIYKEAQSELRKGLDDLMRARKFDPFADTPKRLAYERIFNKQAPTFEVKHLNS